jgi:hypothetical protein
MKPGMLRSALVAVPAFAVLTGSASAADVNVIVPRESAPVVIEPSQPAYSPPYSYGQPSYAPPAPPSVVVQPSQPSVIVQPPASTPALAAPETILAEDIRANQVRARTIYANKIRAREVLGAIHQTDKVDVGKGRHDIKAPMVTASVIYADEIRADSVMAEHIFVRDLDRK